MDIAIAKELLTNLIAACEELQIERESVKSWQAMLDKMPAYEVGSDGDQAEWADGGIFNFDGNGPCPAIVNRSLAFSLGGTLDLLRAVPPSWTGGSIGGILVRG